MIEEGLDQSDEKDVKRARRYLFGIPASVQQSNAGGNNPEIVSTAKDKPAKVAIVQEPKKEIEAPAATEMVDHEEILIPTEG